MVETAGWILGIVGLGSLLAEFTSYETIDLMERFADRQPAVGIAMTALGAVLIVVGHLRTR